MTFPPTVQRADPARTLLQLFNKMILDILPALASLKIVLASSSPRRLELLSQLGLRVEVRPSKFSETLSKAGVAPSDYVRATARGKALDVERAAAAAGGTLPDIIISSDTVVVSEHGDILEKPADREDARCMLDALSGRTHSVLTAVCVVVRSPLRAGVASLASAPPTSLSETTDAGNTLISFVEATEVVFATLPPALIDAYVQTTEPYDKAGGYGIQGVAAQFVSAIRGDHSCVVGFPVHAFCVLVRALAAGGMLPGVALLSSHPSVGPEVCSESRP